jgi:hypothetical protein
MLMLAADAIRLAGDVDGSRSLLRTVRQPELAATGGRDVIAEAASALGDHRFVLDLLEQPADDYQRRIQALALAAVGTDAQAEEGIQMLDELVTSSNEDVAQAAALSRLLLTLTRPGTDWSSTAEQRLADTAHTPMAISLKANWLGRHEQWQEVDALLASYGDEGWALEARLEALAGHPDASLRKGAAERVLLQTPEPSVRFSCGVTLYEAGERDRGLAEAQQVARDPSAELYVRTEAYRFLASKAIEHRDGRVALTLLGEWAELEPQSPALNALFPRAAALLSQK